MHNDLKVYGACKIKAKDKYLDHKNPKKPNRKDY